MLGTMLEDLSHHILDIAENGVNAGADEISVEIDDELDEIRLIVTDNGRGMDEKIVKAVVNPFFTTRTERRVGLGIPFIKQIAELCGGEFFIVSAPGRGTKVTASFRKESIDIPPIGDIPSTLLTLFIGNPHVLWKYIHKRNGKVFSLNSMELAEALGGGYPFANPVLAMGVKEFLEENIRDLYSE